MTSEPSQSAARPTESSLARRSVLLGAGAAGLCWAGVLATLMALPLNIAPVLSVGRLIFYVLIGAAALLTFVPIQVALRAPGLALQGVAGAFVLLYSLAFVPPPTQPIYSLPDLPVYVLLLGGLFTLTSAIALPVVMLVGKRMFRTRARQYDLRRGRRQAHEVGVLFVGCGVLAGLRILTPLSVVLVALALVAVETLFLAYVETES